MDQLFSALYIEDERLAAYASSAARLLRVTKERGGASSAALRHAYGAVKSCREALTRRYGDAAHPPAACEWLLDNWYLVQREGRAALAALRDSHRQRQCADGALIQALCRSLLSAGQGRLTERRCLSYLRGFQSVTPLRRCELLLFGAAMRAALIEALARVCQTLPYAADTSEQAAAFETLFGSLRWLCGADEEAMLERVDLCDEALRGDPGGCYGAMDRESRRDYLRRLEQLAREQGIPEHLVARRLVRQAQEEGRHVGFLLFEPPERSGAAVYIALVVLVSLFLSLLLAFSAGNVWVSLLLLLPVSALVKGMIDYLLLRSVPPRRLPRMDLSRGVPAEGKCLCVLSALLTDPESAARLCRRMEELRLSNHGAGQNLQYGLLADLPAADASETAEDADTLCAAREAVTALNRRYGSGFYLFTRPRRFDGARWSGWERKRGALLELARLLDDQPSELRVTGERDALSGTRYILTLDSDTRMEPDAALALIGAMLHPMNRAQINEDKRVVTAGYGLLHPRLATELGSANATDFSLIFAGPGGSDPYGALCGELGMTLFDCGGFAGKGILDRKALLLCTDGRLPEGRVLSHDALEGAFLRGGYLGDVVFADAFPARPLSYYRRLHRWVRGDWQNSPWLFSRGRSLRPIDRWRLFDSLRRSLLAPATLAALLLGFFLPGYGLKLSAWAALLAFSGNLVESLVERARQHASPPRLRRYARLLTGVGGALVRSMMQLWLLPWEAFTCLSAVLTALWRMLVTHRKLLEWETAAQSERRRGGLLAYVRALWLPVLTGLLCLLFAPSVIGRSAGLLWLLSPAAAAALALPAFRVETLSRSDRDYLRERAADTWRYFAENCTARDHFLPPDNVQHQPPLGAAHRSSPTNMGLAAAAAVAACELDLIPRAEALAFLERLIGSMERLPRALGHFYNWYDTETLQVLHPPFLSTVDSGNCFAALTVAADFAREQGAGELARRIEALLETMDFRPLYDPVRELFFICYDTARGCGAGGFYDLMASEAMLTSYLTVARGDAPLRHWRRLGRAQTQKDGFRGLVSWTGTMFEYLMPALFLPFPRGSLLYESSRLCVYAQRRCVQPWQPWGISESAYFALDGSRSYRYKAHGCAALALRREQERETVIAPYASFLALAVAPRAAVQNLRRLERRGLVGRFGFREALDLTPGRCRDSQGEIVDSTMAHHAGMSLLAAANALCDGVIRRRFLHSAAMGAHELLLQEQPGDGAVFKRRTDDPPAARQTQIPPGRWQQRGEPGESGFCLLSNGAYALALNDCGTGEVLVEDGPVPYGEAQLLLDGAPLLPGEGARWLFTEDQAEYRLERGGRRVEAQIFVSADKRGELRELRLSADQESEARVELCFRPLLCRRRDWESHPAFWQLGLWAEAREGALLLRRLSRADLPETWLCLHANAPLCFTADEGGGLGWLSRPFVRSEAKLRLENGAAVRLRFALCMASNAAEALNGARELLDAGEAERGRMIGGAATLLGLSAGEIGQTMALLGALKSARLRGAAPLPELWRLGLSGELPILCCRSGERENEALLRRFLLLRSAGLQADLVFFSAEEGEYRQPFRRALTALLARYGLEAMLGVRGGVHLLPESEAALVESRAAFIAGSEPERTRPAALPVLGDARTARGVPDFSWQDGVFCFEAGGALPARPWQQILTNGRLGCVVTESGSGFLWLDNAREQPLTEGPRLPGGLEGGEALWTLWEGRPVSLFAANDTLPCTVRYAPGLAVWEKQLGKRRVKTTAFIAQKADLRLLLIEGAEGLPLFWAQRLSRPESLRASWDGRVFCAESPDAWQPGLRYLAASNQKTALDEAALPELLRFRVEAGALTVLACGCADRDTLLSRCDGVAALSARDEAAAYWISLCTCGSVDAPDAAMARYLKGWGAYQLVACRLLGRCSLYQRGGAYGFRDQLQDAANALFFDKSFLRERLIESARHQYVEGDVMHWWHAGGAIDRGLRSRCADDLLWLPWALCEWLDGGGDEALCRQEEPFLDSPPLREDERDRYEAPPASENRASLVDHARAALDCCLRRGFGPHGLPLMLGGDWNDGFDRAGGESVWLGFFLASCAARFASLLDRLSLPGADAWRAVAARVGAAADTAFENGRYLRGYWPDGSPLGGEARIDATAQSWAVLSGFGSHDKCAAALALAWERLVDREHGLVRLFTPPFSPDERSPGYISSYGEGFRENGGQYTHGAIWLAMALGRLGQRERAEEILRLVLPSATQAARYGAEPYVLAADVYAAPDHEGEAGWSWYTGSAGWYLRAARELFSEEE